MVDNSTRTQDKVSDLVKYLGISSCSGVSREALLSGDMPDKVAEVIYNNLSTVLRECMSPK